MPKSLRVASPEIDLEMIKLNEYESAPANLNLNSVSSVAQDATLLSQDSISNHQSNLTHLPEFADFSPQNKPIHFLHYYFYFNFFAALDRKGCSQAKSTTSTGIKICLVVTVGSVDINSAILPKFGNQSFTELQKHQKTSNKVRMHKYGLSLALYF